MEHGAPTAAGLGPSPLITRPGTPGSVFWCVCFCDGQYSPFQDPRNRTPLVGLGRFGSWKGRCVSRGLVWVVQNRKGRFLMEGKDVVDYRGQT